MVVRKPDSISTAAYRRIAGSIAASLSILTAEMGDVMGEFDLKWEELQEI
jgi:hypothetical protein